MQLDLTTTQWAVLAGAVALVAFPRLGGIKTWFAGLLAKVKSEPINWTVPILYPTTTDKIYQRVNAYQTLAAVMPVDLAKQVWACIQEPPGIEPAPMPATKTED